MPFVGESWLTHTSTHRLLSALRLTGPLARFNNVLPGIPKRHFHAAGSGELEETQGISGDLVSPNAVRGRELRDAYGHPQAAFGPNSHRLPCCNQGHVATHQETELARRDCLRVFGDRGNPLRLSFTKCRSWARSSWRTHTSTHRSLLGIRLTSPLAWFKAALPRIPKGHLHASGAGECGRSQEILGDSVQKNAVRGLELTDACIHPQAAFCPKANRPPSSIQARGTQDIISDPVSTNAVRERKLTDA